MTQQLLVRISEEDRALLDAVCELDGVSRSEMIRRLIRESARSRQESLAPVIDRWFSKAMSALKDTSESVV